MLLFSVSIFLISLVPFVFLIHITIRSFVRESNFLSSTYLQLFLKMFAFPKIGWKIIFTTFTCNCPILGLFGYVRVRDYYSLTLACVMYAIIMHLLFSLSNPALPNPHVAPYVYIFSFGILQVSALFLGIVSCTFYFD